MEKCEDFEIRETDAGDSTGAGTANTETTAYIKGLYETGIFLCPSKEQELYIGGFIQ